MKATFDGTTVIQIEYSAKEIKPHFCQATRELEYDLYYGGRYVGTAYSNQEAHSTLDALAYDELMHRVTL